MLLFGSGPEGSGKRPSANLILPKWIQFTVSEISQALKEQYLIIHPSSNPQSILKTDSQEK